MTSFYITIYTICGIYLLLNFKFEIQMFHKIPTVSQDIGNG